MDFHTLSRRDLQALCKKNRIPANMTNVAMADALHALNIVDGIDEIQEDIQFQSPKKADAGSPELPRTGRRASARRAPAAEEPREGQASPLPRARRVTARASEMAMTDETEEEKTVKPPLTGRKPRATARKEGVEEGEKQPVVVEIPDTPAAPSGRRTLRCESVGTSKKATAKKGTDVPIEISDTPATRTTRRTARVAESPVVEASVPRTQRRTRQQASRKQPEETPADSAVNPGRRSTRTRAANAKTATLVQEHEEEEEKEIAGDEHPDESLNVKPFDLMNSISDLDPCDDVRKTAALVQEQEKEIAGDEDPDESMKIKPFDLKNPITDLKTSDSVAKIEGPNDDLKAATLVQEHEDQEEKEIAGDEQPSDLMNSISDLNPSDSEAKMEGPNGDLKTATETQEEDSCNNEVTESEDSPIRGLMVTTNPTEYEDAAEDHFPSDYSHSCAENEDEVHAQEHHTISGEIQELGDDHDGVVEHTEDIIDPTPAAMLIKEQVPPEPQSILNAEMKEEEAQESEIILEDSDVKVAIGIQTIPEAMSVMNEEVLSPAKNLDSEAEKSQPKTEALVGDTLESGEGLASNTVLESTEESNAELLQQLLPEPESSILEIVCCSLEKINLCDPSSELMIAGEPASPMNLHTSIGVSVESMDAASSPFEEATEALAKLSAAKGGKKKACSDDKENQQVVGEGKKHSQEVYFSRLSMRKLRALVKEQLNSKNKDKGEGKRAALTDINENMSTMER